MNLPRFSDLLKQSWPLYKKYILSLIGFVLIAFAIGFVFGFIGNLLEPHPANVDTSPNAVLLILQLIGWVINIIVSIGFIHIYLKIGRNEAVGVRDLFEKANRFFPYLFGQLLTGLIVMVGFLLLIAPGIWWAIQFSYTPYLIIDKNMGPIEAMKASSRMTKGIKGTLILYGLGFLGLNLLGLLVLFVGVIITVPLTWIANVLIYLSLVSRLQAPATTQLDVNSAVNPS